MREIQQTKKIRIPKLISAVRCGYDSCLEDGTETIEIDVPADFQIRANGTYIVNAYGDSMLPTVEDGDKLFIAFGTTLRSGDMGLMYHNGDLTVKRYFQRGFSHFLVPENKAYEDVKINGDTYLVGKVFQIIKEVKNIKE